MNISWDTSWADRSAVYRTVCSTAQLQTDVLRLQVAWTSPVPAPRDSVCTCRILGGLLAAFLALPSSAAQEPQSLQRSVHKDADVKETFRLAKDLPHHILTRGMKPKGWPAWTWRASGEPLLPWGPGTGEWQEEKGLQRALRSRE